MLTCYKALEKIWFKLPQKLRYLLVGGFNTVFSYGFFALMILGADIPYQAAIFISYVVSVNVSIFTMRCYVFRSRGGLRHEYAKAWGVYLSVLLLNYVLMYVMVEAYGLNVLLSQAFCTAVITVFTYLLHKHFSFAK